jgi:hypothetical protein
VLHGLTMFVREVTLIARRFGHKALQHYLVHWAGCTHYMSHEIQ